VSIITSSALILVEFQNEWLSSEGKLYSLFEDKTLLNTAISNTHCALTHARDKSIPVIYTAMGFSPNYTEHVCILATAWAAHDLG